MQTVSDCPQTVQGHFADGPGRLPIYAENGSKPQLDGLERTVGTFWTLTPPGRDREAGE